MTYVLKALVAGTALVAFAGAASADDAVSAEFAYDASVSVEANYASFQRTAKRACLVDLREAGSVSGKSKIEKACVSDLMDSVVEQIGGGELIALHEDRSKPAPQQARTYAQAR